MGTKKTILALVLIFNTCMLQAQTVAFNRMSDNKDITYVMISKAILSSGKSRFSGRINNMLNRSGLNVGNLMDKLEYIEIFTPIDEGNKTTRKLMKSVALSIRDDKSYSTVMRVKEEDEDIAYYGQKNKKRKDLFDELVMIIDSSSECLIIRIVGEEISLGDIEKGSSGK